MSNGGLPLNPPRALGGLTFIEQLQTRSLKLCSNSRVPYLSGRSADALFLVRGSCGSWSCPSCGARNGSRWLARMLNYMNKNKGTGAWYFLTITAHEKTRGQTASIANIRQGWKKLYNRMRHTYGISEYVKIWEFHADGSFHLHILIRRKIGKKWLKNNSRACGMGYMCDSTQSKNPGQVAGYIAKYLIKSFENSEHYERGMRRIEASRNWDELPDLASDIQNWRVFQSRDAQDRHAVEARGAGQSVVDLRPSELKINKIIDLSGAE